MSRIYIDILAAKGHFNGTIKLASVLKNAGHEVIYISDISIEKQVNELGYKFRETIPVTKPLFLTSGTLKIKIGITNMVDAFQKKGMVKVKENLDNLKQLLNEDKPDLVLLDEQNMLKAAYYELLNIPVITLETKPDPLKHENIPPFTSLFVPRNSSFSKIYCNWLWHCKFLKNYFILKFIRLNTFKQDRFSLMMKVCKEYGLHLKKRIDLNRSYGIGLKEIPRCIVSPPAFDFPHIPANETFGIGTLVDLKREGQINNPRYKVLLGKLKTFDQSKGGMIIYCSLGTVTQKFKKKMNFFFKKILEVARLNQDDFYILSTGSNYDINQLYPIPDNMFIYEYVPQVDLLSYCQLMITHGGMNSIAECVFSEVPVIVYPLSKDWDQPGNSARVVFHKIGLRGKIKKDSVKLISKKINQIRKEYNNYKQRIIEMKSKFEEDNSSNRILEVVDKYKKYS